LRTTNSCKCHPQQKSHPEFQWVPAAAQETISFCSLVSAVHIIHYWLFQANLQIFQHCHVCVHSAATYKQASTQTLCKYVRIAQLVPCTCVPTGTFPFSVHLYKRPRKLCTQGQCLTIGKAQQTASTTSAVYLSCRHIIKYLPQ
jgi:hypothetical protein